MPEKLKCLAVQLTERKLGASKPKFVTNSGDYNELTLEMRIYPSLLILPKLTGACKELLNLVMYSGRARKPLCPHSMSQLLTLPIG